MNGELEIIEGPDKGRVIPFAEGQTLLIGRGPNTATKLTDRYTSRVHCQLVVQGGLLTLSDLGGAGGTRVNGTPITGPQVVLPGDVIIVGATRLRVHAGPAGEDRTIQIPAMTATPDSSPTLNTLPTDAGMLEGRVLAHYDVGPILGMGQTGVVYQARPKAPAAAEPVALKVFHLAFVQSEAAKQRFLRASRTVMHLRHPNLVAVLDAGETGPFCWMAMELVEGESLARVIQRIGIADILDWRYGLRIAVHIARGLEFAQQHQIIHRNITPSNILLRKSDRCAKLGDLILAKTLSGGEEAQAITRPGDLLGSIAYMSPERALGQPIDGRSDLYELGATIYALLTGKPPVELTSVADLKTALQTREPIPPKQVQLSIPDAFEAIVLRMLAKQPALRFQSPTELIHALMQVARAENVAT